MSPDAPDYLALFANYKDEAGPRDLGQAYLEADHEGYRLLFEQVCKLLNHMDSNGYAEAIPRRNDPEITEQPVLDFSSGYVQRALPNLPKQGSKKPWRLSQNYALDLAAARFGTVDDGTMVFGRPGLERPSA